MDVSKLSLPSYLVALAIFLLVLALIIVRRVRGVEFPI